MSDEPKSTPAGWYAHPTMADTQQYWDGTKWTTHVAPGQSQRSQAKEQEQRDGGLLTAGVIMMIIFPIGGFIAGCILLGRRAGAGMAIMLFSLVSAFVWYGILTADDELECQTESAERVLNGLPALPC